MVQAFDSAGPDIRRMNAVWDHKELVTDHP